MTQLPHEAGLQSHGYDWTLLLHLRGGLESNGAISLNLDGQLAGELLRLVDEPALGDGARCQFSTDGAWFVGLWCILI